MAVHVLALNVCRFGWQLSRTRNVVGDYINSRRVRAFENRQAFGGLCRQLTKLFFERMGSAYGANLTSLILNDSEIGKSDSWLHTGVTLKLFYIKYCLEHWCLLSSG